MKKANVKWNETNHNGLFQFAFFILPALPYKYLLYLPVLTYVTLLTIGPPSSTNFFILYIHFCGFILVVR